MANKKEKYVLEYPIRCSPSILYDFLYAANGLQEWFADKVDSRDNTFYFTWNGATDEAEQLEAVENEYVRYRWDYYDEDEYFEFRITRSHVTNETILQIIDFADKFDIDDQKQLWDTQIVNLKQRLGS